MNCKYNLLHFYRNNDTLLYRKLKLVQYDALFKLMFEDQKC